MSKITKTLIYHDGSKSEKTIDNDNDPIGCVCESGWGCDPKKGYVELHPKKGKTIQVIVDQKAGTIEIAGFWKSFKQGAVNSVVFKF